MAEFALGLTKTAVEGTLSRVKSAIEEEKKIEEKVQNNLELITGEFEMMRSFLNVANKERAKNEVVRTWVRQIRDLAFDVEDCVELGVSLDVKSGWTWIWRVLPSCMAPSRPLDDVVAKIEQLKARVEDVSQRNTRYNLITSGDGGGDESNHDSDQQTAVGGASSAEAGATFHVLRKVWKDTGKLHDAVSTSDLKKLIDCQGSKLQVISLWGSPQADAIGQLGWKAMVKQAYDDPCTCQEFKNRSWVKLTHPFNPVEFLNTLLTHFTSHLHHHHDMPELMRQVSQHKYLIVLEQELSSFADWDAIKMLLPDGNNGSRIVVCTKHLGIALACTRDPYQVWELRPFLRDQYLYAFFPKGCGHRIGMGELSWQLRRPGVLSVFGETHDDRIQLMNQFYDGDGDFRVPDGVEFEHCCTYHASQYKLAALADKVLRSSYPEKLNMMSSKDKIEMSRKLLTDHDWIVCIRDLRSCTDWDLIKQDLLPAKLTRCCILVTTSDRSVAKHCVDRDESRALDAKDLLRGFEPQEHHGQIYYVREDSIQEEDKFEPGKLVGREDVVRGFDSVSHVAMSFWGIAGVGKSAVVREIYYNQKTSALNYQTFGRVDVPHPFNLAELCRRLLLDFYSDEAKEAVAISMMEGQDPTHWCSQILHQRIFLIVLDGLQSTHDWDLIKTTLLSQPIIGTTIVITREESIATHCTEDEHFVVNIKGLRDDNALDLFTKIALDGKQLSSHPSLPEANMLNLIISKCGGLPEIITAIGKGLHSELDISVLEYINNDFIGILEGMPGLRGLFCWMQSYFDACRDELKPCIFYLSVFPVGEIIRRRRLLRRWIAEGYSSGGGGTTEEKGEKLLSELMKLSIIYQEDQETSTIKGCKVNGFFGAYIRSRPMEDNLVFALEGSCSPSSRLTGQHLTISSSWDRDETVFNSIDLSRLRSLTVFGAWKSFLTSEKMKLLRVLDLEGTNTLDDTCVTDDDLEEIGKLLHRLKFLSLRGCQQITRLPDSLGDMRQLETLDARHTSIVELPPAIITKLHKLQYIRAGTSKDTSLLLLEKKTSIPLPPTTSTPTPLSEAAAAAPPPPPPPPSTPPPPPLPSTPTPTPPQEGCHGGTSPSLRATTEARVAPGASTRITKACKRKAHDLVESSSNNWWKLKNHLNLRNRRRVAANGGGVEIGHAAAQGIWRLTDMHTLGVVNVACGKGGLLFLEEVKRLTQLRKLGLSGINRENWRRLCDAISGHLHHLESLSLQLMLLEEEGDSFDFACFDNIVKPPKTIDTLKVLYTTAPGGAAGGACLRSVWLKKLPKVQSLDHELTISSQEDIRDLDHTLSRVTEILIKPTEELLSFEKQDQYTYRKYLYSVDSLRIECSSTMSHSKVTFGELLCFSIYAISIHCCCSSSAAGTSAGSCNLHIAKLDQIRRLRLVTVTGTYADGLKRYLREQVDNHPNKPVLE